MEQCCLIARMMVASHRSIAIRAKNRAKIPAEARGFLEIFWGEVETATNGGVEVDCV
jgi:hypothetical protein